MAQLVPVDTFDLIIFGGTGDLAMRKLLPALYHRDCDGQITDDSRIIAASRGAMSRNKYLAEVEASLRKKLTDDSFNEAHWKKFKARIFYAQADAFEPKGWGALSKLLKGKDDRVRVAYLATAPKLFGPIAEGMKANGLVTDSCLLRGKPDLSNRSLSRQGNRSEPARVAFRKLIIRTVVATQRDRPCANYRCRRPGRRWARRLLRRSRRDSGHGAESFIAAGVSVRDGTAVESRSERRP